MQNFLELYRSYLTNTFARKRALSYRLAESCVVKSMNDISQPRTEFAISRAFLSNFIFIRMQAKKASQEMDKKIPLEKFNL